MAGRGIKAGGDGKVTDLSTARKAAGERKADGIPTNNLQAIREQEEAQLLSILAQCRPAIAKVEEAKAIVKQRQEDVNAILDKAVAQGFKKGEIRDLLKDTAVTGARKSLREAEERRVRFRRYVGLPVGETQEDIEAIPEAAMDEIDWELDGYRAGVRAEEPKPPAKCPERFHQVWMKGWHDGQARNAWAMNGGTGAPPEAPSRKPKATPEPDAEPEDDFEASPDELASQAGRPSAQEDGEGPEAV